mmetsp:Transcript_14814/g.30505  ORF Transcript_14814/g.30505 Transcript_14814/m.30505 type:complete len:289 (+) Transcript_14814:14-880(+)
MSLLGQTIWVVGGIGPIGRNISRSLLLAGANVIVNSRSESRLQNLSKDLSFHPRLIAVHGSLLPGKANETVNKTLSYSNVSLNHVVAHGAVRWWANGQNGGFSSMDESRMTVPSKGFLDNDVDEFLSASQQSLKLHFSAAQHLLPRLRASSASSSYTFVTGESGNSVITRNPYVMVGSRAVQGLAESIRQEVRGYEGVTSTEVRVGLKINRTAEERAREPREVPLSSRIGDICAGICAKKDGDERGLVHHINTMETLEEKTVAFKHEVEKGNKIKILWNWEGGGQKAA